MKMLQAPNGFKIPFSGGWSITEAGYLRAKPKPRIFHRGYGWFSYKTTGPKAWVEVEIPDPPKEPDPRFNPEAHAKWLPKWLAYVEEHGIVAAAKGSHCCEASLERYVFSMVTRRDSYPPQALMDRVKNATGIDPYRYNDPLMFAVGQTYSLNLFAFADHLMKSKGFDYEAWEREVEQSLSDWIKEQFGEETEAAVKELLEWRVDPEAEKRYREFVNAYCQQRDEALVTLRTVK